MDLSVQELEAAINSWRTQRPARGHEGALAPEVQLLARICAPMIYRRATIDIHKLAPDAQQLLQRWRQHTSESRPDA